MSKDKYYRLTKIDEKNAQYNVIVGERSNGKSYAVQERGLEKYINTGKQMAIIRRWEEDFKGKRGQETFAGIVESENGNKISKMTKGKWTGIKYYASKWYLCKKDNELNKLIVDETPFCYAFALTQQEHDKSTNYPNITTILFDEFLTRASYLPDEFILFQNVLSTIIRHRNDVTIYMCANTVNKYAPYFIEMGINHIDKMKQGDIDVYEYGESGLRVAVEYTESPESRKTKKQSDIYFAFDNPKLNMITKGSWEMNIYPHLPFHYVDKDIKYIYFVEFNNRLLQCEIICAKNPSTNKKDWFTYIHNKTSDLKYNKLDIIFTVEYYSDIRLRRNLLKPTDELGNIIKSFYTSEKVFFQNNEIGEIMRNYLLWCKTDKGYLV